MQDKVQQVNIGGHRIRLVGLDEIFEELGQRHITDENELKRLLVEGVKSRNYVSRSAEEVYGVALLREYKKSLGLEVEEEGGGLQIKVLGPGCPECDRLQREVMEVLSELRVPADLEHVSDIKEIGSYGVLGTPALVVSGTLRSSGRAPMRGQIKRWIEEAGANP